MVGFGHRWLKYKPWRDPIRDVIGY